MLLTVVDYGVGNLRSIAKSIEKANSDSNLNYSVKVSSDIYDVKKSDKIVLPGQGSFKACKAGIDNIKGMQAELNESVLIKKKPIYGIWAIFAPGHIMSTYGTPQEFLGPITINIVMLFGVSAWVVAILGWHIRTTVTEENVEKAMSYFALAWLLYGLHGVFSEKAIVPVAAV